MRISGVGWEFESGCLGYLIRPPLEKEFEACKASGANLLAFRPHSRAEMAAKLTDKGYDRETIEQALDRLRELVWKAALMLAVRRLSPLSWKWVLWCGHALHCPAIVPCAMQPHAFCVQDLQTWTLSRGQVLNSCCAHVLQGLQSDREFAAVFARSKWRQSRWAPSRIRIVSAGLSSCSC